MKNLNFKKVSGLFTLAILAGVLSLGIHAVSGANPSVNPPGTGVAPTFTGLTVNGNTIVNGVLGISGDVTTSNGDIAAPNGFIAGQSMELSGNAEIDGTLVSNGINLLGTLFNNTSSNDGMVKIADLLDITGAISNSAGSLVLDDTVDIKNTISNSAGALVLDDTVDVKNTINNSGTTNMSTVKINDNLDVVDNVQSQKNIVVGYANGGKLMIKAPGYANTINVATGEITSVTGLILDSTDGSIENTAGNVKIDDNLDITGIIKNPNAVTAVLGAYSLSNPQVVIQGDLKTTGTGNIFATGIIQNDKTTPGGADLPLRLYDNVVFSGSLSALNAAPVTIDDAFKVTGTTTLETTNVNQNITIDGTANFAAKLYNSAGSLLLEDNVYVKSSTDVSTGGAAFKIDSGAGSPSWLGIDRNEIGVYGGALYLQNDSGTDVYIGGASNSNLIVNGNIKANKIGNFTRINSNAFNQIAPNNNVQIINGSFNGVTCPAGYQVISCGFNVYSAPNSNSEYHGSGVTPTSIVQNDNADSCAADFWNATGSTKYMKLYAMCFNPSVNN